MSANLETAPMDDAEVSQHDDAMLGGSGDENVIEETGTTPVEKSAAGADSSFDASQYEAMFGLPEGALANAKTAGDVLDFVRGLTDKSLIAAMSLSSDVPSEPASSKAAKIEDADSDNTDEKIKAAVEAALAPLRKQQEEYATAELQRRFLAEVDSWKSDRYGVKDSRNYKQLKATQELFQHVMEHAAGVSKTSGPLASIEALARRVRVWHDETYSPVSDKAPARPAPLGSPGAKSKNPTSNSPRNIHEAFASGWVG